MVSIEDIDEIAKSVWLRYIKFVEETKVNKINEAIVIHQ
jgi:hypothetical protein